MATSSVQEYLTKEGIAEYHVPAMPTWDDFEELANFVAREFAAIVIESIDGICSRTRKLEAAGHEVIIKHHDDIGNFFFTLDDSAAGRQLMKDITSAISSKID